MTSRCRCSKSRIGPKCETLHEDYDRIEEVQTTSKRQLLTQYIAIGGVVLFVMVAASVLFMYTKFHKQEMDRVSCNASRDGIKRSYFLKNKNLES
jgi:hypothetical protein